VSIYVRTCDMSLDWSSKLIHFGLISSFKKKKKLSTERLCKSIKATVCTTTVFLIFSFKIWFWIELIREWSRKMGKGGMSVDDDVEQQNMAAWLVGLNTLKIQPFNLPSLGIRLKFPLLISLCYYYCYCCCCCCCWWWFFQFLFIIKDLGFGFSLVGKWIVNWNCGLIISELDSKFKLENCYTLN